MQEKLDGSNTSVAKVGGKILALGRAGYLAEIGRRGGQKSKRKLTKAQARAMVRARTAKRALRQANAPHELPERE